ncbi:MAG TPA: PaaI family thioesterase [Candidatus Limnocylindrales bacterium]|jgi:acyl-coenzyme A thioesterase PaaI-like protein
MSGSSTVPDDGRTYRFVVDPHHCFVCGELNARGLHATIYARTGTAWTDLTLGPDFVGWSDKAHGGVLATLLDEIMGWALFEHDCWGVTAELTVRYLQPVDVNQPLHVEGEVVDVDRRLFRTRGRILGLDGAIKATAEARYVAAPEARKAELRAAYRFHMVPVDGSDARSERPA